MAAARSAAAAPINLPCSGGKSILWISGSEDVPRYLESQTATPSLSSQLIRCLLCVSCRVRREHRGREDRGVQGSRAEEDHGSGRQLLIPARNLLFHYRFPFNSFNSLTSSCRKRNIVCYLVPVERCVGKRAHGDTANTKCVQSCRVIMDTLHLSPTSPVCFGLYV